MKVDVETMTLQAPSRFEKAPRPTVHTGIGDALRQAFDLNGEARVFDKFEDLLARLN